MATITYMNRIKTDYVVTTTPHLDVYMLKRSPHVKKYIYLFHAPTSVDVYEKFAFNRYDIMLCPGKFIETYIRELEALRGLPRKELYFTGCTYYDFMLEEKKQSDFESDMSSEKTVLYAPTWGERSSLLKFGSRIFDILIKAGYRIIFRPHPQYYVSHSELIGEIEEKYTSGTDVVIDREITGMRSMANAGLMITDLSGIIFDFAYLHEKPIILLDVSLDLEGFEGGDLSESWNTIFSERLSTVVSEDELDSLPGEVENLLANTASLKKEIAELRDSQLTAFGKSGELTADTLMNIMDRSGV